jgi:hypothetical protein
MTVDLYRIDQIQDYDEAIDALEEYVADLVEEFVEAPEGKAYLSAHSEMAEYIGSWIDQLLYFGYAYQSVTLPRMTKNQVETIVTELFPQKVSLLDPDDADSTIPELIAFWEFLKRQYKHPQSSKILTFLKKIQPKFKDLMNDSSKFGMAKSFLTAGLSSGFDMTTEEGLRAFQEHYNQNLRESAGGEALPGLSQPNFPIADIAENMPAELRQLFTTIAGAVQADEELGDMENLFAPEPDDFMGSLQASMWQQAVEALPPLSEESITILRQQSITPTEPGTILQDFHMLLEAIGDTGIAVSGTYHLFSQKLLAEFNQRLSQPIQLDLKRPVQKSYPPLNGLYLLLRATGLGQIVGDGKKHKMILNPDILQSWNSLNPTEQYFTLLEAWMIRADEEILGERRSPLNEGTKCVQFWPRLPQAGQTFKKFVDQQNLNYWPELHNLALMQLFGFLHLESGKPEAGKGWRVKKIKPLPFGDAMMQVIVRAYMEQGMGWPSETDDRVAFGELQPAFQPYFPEWRNTLAIPRHEFRAGVHIFKVTLGKAWRRIAISGEMTLADLSGLILESVDFDSDHLDMFRYRNAIGRTMEITHPYADGSPSTTEVRVGDLPLAEGTSMLYVFDFGDWWEFDVQLETVQTSALQLDYATILESHGEAPPQYPDWDEE